MILRKRLLYILVILIPVISFAAGNEPDSKAPDSTRFERLAGLCRLWGAIKYFHPYLAYQNIDWDGALIKTIPRVNKAETPEDYKRAIEYLLSSLKDPNTFIRDDSYVTPRSKISDLPETELCPYIIWTDDSIAIIVANDLERLFAADYFSLSYELKLAARKANGLIFDFRDLGPDSPDRDEDDCGSNLEMNLRFYMPVVLRKSIAIPSRRSRTYTLNRQGHYARHDPSLIYRPGGTCSPSTENRRDSLPMVFILNEGSADGLTFLGGLQDSRQAAIVFEGLFDREGGIKTFPVQTADGVIVEVRLTEIVRSDGTGSVHPDLVIPFVTDTTLMDCPPIKTALEVIRGTREVPCVVGNVLPITATSRPGAIDDALAFQKSGNRLLAWFRIWNEIRYFSPYVDGFEPSWETSLKEMIPVFEMADTRRAYALAINQAAHRLQDSNTRFGYVDNLEHLGYYFPALAIDFIEGKTVVTFISDDDQKTSAPDLEIGDIILAIDGEEIGLRRNRFAGYLSASTSQAMNREINSMLLSSTMPAPISMTLQKRDGRIIDVSRPRSDFEPPYPDAANGFRREGNDFIYINPQTTASRVITDSLGIILRASGLILDLRGDWQGGYFLNQEYWLLAGIIAGKEAVACQTRAVTKFSPDPNKSSWEYDSEKVRPNDKYHYEGRVAVLIDPSTMSDAEKYSLYLGAAGEVAFIGMPTGGVSAYWNDIELPGQTTFAYTNVDILDPDDPSVFGVGIQPDIFVEPTIEGIRQGKDEILEAAIKFLEKELTK